MKRLCERKSYAELGKTGKIMRSWGWAAIAAVAVILVAVITVAVLRARYSTSVIRMDAMFCGCKLPNGFSFGGHFDTSNVTSIYVLWV